MKDIPIDFHGSKFTIKVLTSEASGHYTVLDVFHSPNTGPSLHMHPKGAETFCIIEGDYEFFLGDKSIMGKVGDIISAPKGDPHRFVSGKKGGHIISISPPDLEFYFWEVGKLLAKGEVSFETESSIGKKYGQVFLDDTKHWK